MEIHWKPNGLYKKLKMTNNYDYEKEMCQSWFKFLQEQPFTNSEPKLDTEIINIIKFACDTLKQDVHVFIAVVDITEEYYSIKLTHDEQISDALLLITSVIFMCSKSVSEQSDLKIKHIQAFLKKITHKHYNANIIKRQEIDIIKTLDNKLPITSQVDDLKLFLEVYVKPMKLRKDLQKLCIDILQIIYIVRKEFYIKLKEFYKQSDNAYSAFKYIINNRFYIPAGIVISALHLTYYQNFINLNKVILELESMLSIHNDHLHFLATHIFDTVMSKSN